MDTPFVHLKIHSEYAIQDSLLRINELVDRCHHLKMPAIAITDPCHLFTAIKFYKEATKKGIKPIFGADLLVKRDNQAPRIITALCKNHNGYLNLSRLISYAHTHKTVDNEEAIIDFETLKKNHDGLIILSGGKDGDIGQALINRQLDQAKKYMRSWKTAFPEHFYLEVQRSGRAHEEDYIQAIAPLAAQEQIPLVATLDVRFLDGSDFEAHEARISIHNGYTLNDNRRPKPFTNQNYLKQPQQMRELFKDLPSALENTNLIAMRCNLNFNLEKNFLPDYPVGNGCTLESFLKKQAEAGLDRIEKTTTKSWGASLKKTYVDRLKHELNIINKMGFPGYFLIVADFISWSKANGIPVGPGRGSGAGSLVAYALGITALDPIKYELLFERFLNPERVSLPDFDIDFCMEGRDRVIDYVTEKYGQDCVSQIITYGTMAAKAVIRDVGRVLGHPYGFVDSLAKLIPFEIGMTLNKALSQEEKLAERYNNEEDVRTLFDLAQKLEGLIRNTGKHAGGVVISPQPIEHFCPLYQDPKNAHPVTQLDKDDCESIGLVKFDFLGLRTLTIIKWALKNIQQSHPEQTLPDIDNIPLDDIKTYELLKSCQTTAVFQLESRGMKELIRRLQPDCFEDIVALVALFRPGPLQSGMVDDFIKRKHGLEPIIYPHPSLEKSLQPTYGVILYQEQVMQIAQILAGYSLGEADLLRRAMGKKKVEAMAKQRAIFVEGASGNNIDKTMSNNIFDLMEKFAGYGFNKSHSAAYAMIAYQTAWLKSHYPAEFMAAVLSSDMDNTDKVAIFVKECQELGLKINIPDINKSNFHFQVESDGSICFGLGAIKGSGESALNALIKERELNGKYKNIFECCERLDTRKLNRRVLESLISAGAFDGLHNNRQCLLKNIDQVLKYADQVSKNKGQNDLFSMGSSNKQFPELMATPEWESIEKLRREKAVLGFYASDHPLNHLGSELDQLRSHQIKTINSLDEKQNTVVAGILNSKRIIKTKRGKTLAILNIEDSSGNTDITLFSEVLEKYQNQLKNESICIIEGEVAYDKFSDGNKIIASEINTIEVYRQKNAKLLEIFLDNQNTTNLLIHKLASILDKTPLGPTTIIINYKNSQAKGQIKIGKKYYLITQELLNHIKDSTQSKIEIHY